MKSRNKPYNILVYEALFRRLQERYRGNNVINSDYQKFCAGYRGEISVDYKLKIIPHKKYIYHLGLRLNNHSLFFQLDTLILTKNFLCILEIKNYRERLVYDSDQKQLVQIIGDQELCYKDPILQAETQKMNLKYWLETRGIIGFPIETLVVSANPSTKITNLQNDPTFYKTFIHAENLPFSLQQIDSTYKNTILNLKELTKLSHLLIKADYPLKQNLVEQYGIRDTHLISGVSCSNCCSFPIKYLFGKWHCHKCRHVDPIAHERTILDCFLLGKDNITNGECRDLLQIHSPRIVNTILNSMNLKKSGNTSARKYHAPNEKDYPQHSTFHKSTKSVLDF